METKALNPAVLVGVIVAVVLAIGVIGYRAVAPATPSPGSYTPGVPPWQEKNNGKQVSAPPMPGTDAPQTR